MNHKQGGLIQQQQQQQHCSCQHASTTHRTLDMETAVYMPSLKSPYSHFKTEMCRAQLVGALGTQDKLLVCNFRLDLQEICSSEHSSNIILYCVDNNTQPNRAALKTSNHNHYHHLKILSHPGPPSVCMMTDRLKCWIIFGKVRRNLFNFPLYCEFLSYEQIFQGAVTRQLL